MTHMRDLSVDFCGIHFENPMMLSSSPVSNTAEMIERAFEAGFGGVMYKCLGSSDVKIVHPSPRMASYDTPDGRQVGVQNVEQTSDRPFQDNLKDIRYLKKHWPTRPVIVNIMGFSRNEWRTLALSCEDAGVDGLELNFSCPHMTVEGAGMKVSHAQELVQEYTHIVREAVKLPLIAKLTPNITDITEPAQLAKRGGADGLSTINTVAALVGLSLDDHTPAPNIFGRGAISGLSGPAIKPIGLRCVTQLAKDEKLGLPISGMGGVETWVDALEYMLCGATTVQITTGVMRYGYRIVEDILEGLSYYMDEKGLTSLSDVIGKALPRIVPTDEFDLTRQGRADYDLDRCVGCGQCYVVCQDAGGQCLTWDGAKRRPTMDEARCLSCMLCSFACPVKNPALITYKEVKGKKPIRPPVSK